MLSRNTVLQFLRLIPHLEYRIVGVLIEALVERLDLLSGDCDLEDDDPCGGNVEDEGEKQEFEWQRYCYHTIDQRVILDSEFSSREAL